MNPLQVSSAFGHYVPTLSSASKTEWFDDVQLAKENSTLNSQLAMMRDFNKGLERNPAEFGLSKEEWANRVRQEAKGL